MDKIPKLRFKEFEEEWKEQKLVNVVKFYKGKGISKSQLSEEGRPCILYGELYTKYNEVVSRVESRTDIDITFTLSEKNDVLIPSSGETAEDISRASCILIDNVALGGDLNILRPTKKVDGRFLSYTLNFAKKKDIARVAQGVSVVHLYASHLKDLRINVPSKKEQEKIIEFISSIDYRIENQENKIFTLERTKIGIMQKIFSQEIRFKDENGQEYPEWKEKRFGDISTFSQGIQIPIEDQTTSYSPKLVPFVRIVDITQKNDDIRYVQNFGSRYYVNKDDLFMVRYGAAGLVAIGYEGIIANNLFKINLVDTNFNRVFFYYLLKSDNFINEIRKNTLESTLSAINFAMLKRINLTFPSTIKEQQRIANLLSTFDKKIEVEKEILETLKDIKKGLLQMMFV